jgi:hypothetical protein
MSHDPTGPYHALLALANTRHGPGGHFRIRKVAPGPDHDHLAEPDDAREFLRTHAVPVPPGLPREADLVALVELRELTRAMSGDLGADGRPVDPPTEPSFVRLAEGRTYSLAPDGKLLSTRDGWSGLIDGLVPDVLRAREELERLHVCSNPVCRFVFYDESRNGSRRWCDPVCGNRVRVGRFRHRHRPSDVL